MRWSLEEKLLASSLGVILLLLGLVNLMSPKNTTELAENANRVQSTYDFLVNLTDFYAAMSVAESGRRGYIFSGRQEELGRYQAAVLGMKAQLNQLQDQVDLSPVQQQRIQKVHQLTMQRLELLDQSIFLHQRDRTATAMQTQHTITDQSVQLREQIQALLTEIKTIENQQLQHSLEQSRLNIQFRSAIERSGIILSLIVTVVLFNMFYWGQKRKQKVQFLEQTLAQEQELSHLKMQLFSMISHEFRTPLSVILASSQLLAEILQPQMEPNQMRNLDRIQNSAKLMNRLITDILIVTRAEAGKLDFQPEWIDIESFCLNLLDDIQSSNPLQHELAFTSEGRGGRVYLDEKLLYSTLSNLLLNAVKYSPNHSQVTFKLQCQPEQIIFEIQDQGMGISQEEQENIFRPFYRGQNVERISGSGLGMAVVQKCLELQKGTIRVESHAGVGTKFIVQIPGSPNGDRTLPS